VESDWRMNVARQGWVGTDMVLLSRLLDFPPFQWLARAETAVGSYALAFTLAFMPDGQQVTPLVLAFDPPGNFPYGYDVEPDRV